MEQPATPDPALVAEALQFGGIALPAGATVLGVERDRGIDRMYRLAVRVEPDGVSRLLADSSFITPLRAGRQVFMTPVAGFALDGNRNVASGQDRFVPAGGSAATITREVLVDRSDPSVSVVHLWLFTT